MLMFPNEQIFQVSRADQVESNLRFNYSQHRGFINTVQIKEEAPCEKAQTNLSQQKLLSSIYTINKMTGSLEKWEIHNETFI